MRSTEVAPLPCSGVPKTLTVVGIRDPFQNARRMDAREAVVVGGRDPTGSEEHRTGGLGDGRAGHGGRRHDQCQHQRTPLNRHIVRRGSRVTKDRRRLITSPVGRLRFLIEELRDRKGNPPPRANTVTQVVCAIALNPRMASFPFCETSGPWSWASASRVLPSRSCRGRRGSASTLLLDGWQGAADGAGLETTDVGGSPPQSRPFFTEISLYDDRLGARLPSADPVRSPSSAPKCDHDRPWRVILRGSLPGGRGTCTGNEGFVRDSDEPGV